MCYCDLTRYWRAFIEQKRPSKTTLHLASISDLSFLPTASIHTNHTANLFTGEVPIMQATFDLGMQEILRVLADDGIVFSKGSAGELEKRLSPHGTMLLPHPPGNGISEKTKLP